VALKAHDFDASVRFYTEGLGLKPALTWGTGDSRAIMLDAGKGNYLEIFAGGTAGRKSDEVLLHLAFHTDDCDAALYQATAAGATVTMGPESLDIPSASPTPVRIAFCTGPDGEVIEFFQDSFV